MWHILPSTFIFICFFFYSCSSSLAVGFVSLENVFFVWGARFIPYPILGLWRAVICTRFFEDIGKPKKQCRQPRTIHVNICLNKYTTVFIQRLLLFAQCMYWSDADENWEREWKKTRLNNKKLFTLNLLIKKLKLKIHIATEAVKMCWYEARHRAMCPM